MDEAIINSLNEGNIHFFFTINFQKEIKKTRELKYKIKELENLLWEKVELMSWYNIINEKHEKGNYHIHGIIAIRTIIGYNDVIINNLTFLIRNNYEIDTLIKKCDNFIEIKKKWKYIYKDFEKKNKNKEKKYIYLKCIEQQENIFDNIKKIINIEVNKEKNKMNEIKGINTGEKDYEEKQILILWEYFLLLNNFVINKDTIYRKIENSIISYEKVSELNKLYENFFEITSYFKINFKIQFNNFNEVVFATKFLKNKEEKIKRFKDITTKKIEFDYNIMEFTDGIYSIKHNKFIRKNKFDKNNEKSLQKFLNEQKINTCKWYNYTFEHIKNPEIWLNSIEKVFGLKERKNTLSDKIAKMVKQDDIKTLLIYLAYIFHFSSNELNKKNTLYIWGPSNTGKTTLIIDVITNYFGKENVGLISNNKNFLYQNMIDKLVLIFDEFNINKINIDDFKKLISKELILAEKKNKEPELMNSTPAIISSNYNIEKQLDFDDNKNAILNRLETIEFKKPLKEDEMDENIKEKIKKEEANIIIYCNRVYHNWIRNGKKTRINDKKMLEEMKKK